MSSPTLGTRILVSWDGSGAFTGTYDDVTSDTASDPGLTVDEGKDGTQTLSPPKVSAGRFELHNEGGRYSRHRADSPLYQQVLPGRPVGFRASLGTEQLWGGDQLWGGSQLWDGIVTYTLGQQIIDEISQATGWGNQRVGIDTIGQEVVLTDSIVTVALQTNIRTDQAVTLLLDAAGWPAARRSIAVGDTTLLYWWCDERHPWDAILEIMAAEGPGAFYVSRDGVAHFENRNYRTITPRSATSQATFYDRVDESELWFVGLGYAPGYRDIYNRATYTTRRRAAAALGQVWDYGAPLSLTPGQTTTLIARPSDPFINAVSPAAGTDYTVSAGSATVSLTYASGFVAFIEIVAGGSGATIVGVAPAGGLQVRAQALTVVSETTVQNTLDASESIARFSPVPGANIPIVLSLNGWAEIEPSSAEAVCDSWISRYQEPRDQLTIGLRNADAAHVSQILERAVSDRITLVEANTGLSADAWINGLELTISGSGGRVVELVMRCELCDVLAGAIWDVSLWDDAAAVWGI